MRIMFAERVIRKTDFVDRIIAMDNRVCQT